MTVMLYRPADEPNPVVWGWNVEHRVFGEADVDAALADGWARHPLDVNARAESRDRLTVEIADLNEPASDDVVVPMKRRGRPPKEG